MTRSSVTETVFIVRNPFYFAMKAGKGLSRKDIGLKLEWVARKQLHKSSICTLLSAFLSFSGFIPRVNIMPYTFDKEFSNILREIRYAAMLICWPL